MYPNTSLEHGFRAICRKLLNRTTNVPSTECIVGAVKLCRTCSNFQFKNKHYKLGHVGSTSRGARNRWLKHKYDIKIIGLNNLGWLIICTKVFMRINVLNRNLSIYVLH